MVKKGYRYVEHTADVEFVARGSTLESMFKSALLAQFDTMADIGKLSKSRAKTQKLEINDSARTLEDLLWFCLQDALSVAEAEGVYAYGVAALSISTSMGEYNIAAVLKAKPKDPSFSKLDVKGVSQFDLKIAKNKKGYACSVVLDV